MEWISVKDRLPNAEISVLAVDADGDMHVAFRTELYEDVKEVMQWTYYDFLPWSDVTHWMPLPAPPITFPEAVNQ